MNILPPKKMYIFSNRYILLRVRLKISLILWCKIYYFFKLNRIYENQIAYTIIDIPPTNSIVLNSVKSPIVL